MSLGAQVGWKGVGWAVEALERRVAMPTPAHAHPPHAHLVGHAVHGAAAAEHDLRAGCGQFGMLNMICRLRVNTMSGRLCVRAPWGCGQDVGGRGGVGAAAGLTQAHAAPFHAGLQSAGWWLAL